MKTAILALFLIPSICFAQIGGTKPSFNAPAPPPIGLQADGTTAGTPNKAAFTTISSVQAINFNDPFSGALVSTSFGLRFDGQLLYPTDSVRDLGLSSPLRAWRNLYVGGIFPSKTITPTGTTGAQTINTTSGSVNFAAAATSLVVTNSLVSTTSVIICTVGTNDSSMHAATAVAAAGSFTLRPDVPPSAETRVNFFITN
jgi:hypothetical protein